MNKRLIGMATVGTLAVAATLALTAGPAAAADCSVGQKGSRYACVQVNNKATDVKSIRVDNGNCVKVNYATRTANGGTRPADTKLQVAVRAYDSVEDRPLLYTYSDTNCKYRNAKTVGWAGDSDSSNYRMVTIQA